jgi:hypothetical protein
MLDAGHHEGSFHTLPCARGAGGHGRGSRHQNGHQAPTAAATPAPPAPATSQRPRRRRRRTRLRALARPSITDRPASSYSAGLSKEVPLQGRPDVLAQRGNPAMQMGLDRPLADAQSRSHLGLGGSGI